VNGKRRRLGQVGHSVVAAATVIPVAGPFVAAMDELYDIWRGDPKAEAALRTDILDRAAELIDAYRGDVEARFADIGGQLTEQLNMLEDLAKRGATTPPLAAAYYAELFNEGLIGGRKLPEAEFAARHLTELDVQVLMQLYDRIDYRAGVLRYPDDFDGRRGLPSLTTFEAAYELARLHTFGFFTSEPDISVESVERRGYKPEIGVIDDFAGQAGLVRVVAISPQVEEQALLHGYAGLQQFELSHMTYGGGAVRFHILNGYEWAVKDFWAGARGDEPGGGWQGTFSEAAEAQAAAEDELQRKGLPVNWLPVAA
jgi:hypothetical protein